MGRYAIFRWLLFGREFYEHFNCFNDERIIGYLGVKELDNVIFPEGNIEKCINSERLEYVNQNDIFIDFPVSDYLNEIHAICNAYQIINYYNGENLNEYTSIDGQITAMIYLA